MKDYCILPIFHKYVLYDSYSHYLPEQYNEGDRTA